MHDVLLGSVKPSLSGLCVQVDCPNPPPLHHMTGVWREQPLSPHLAAMVGLFKPGHVALFVSTVNRCCAHLWQSD